MARMIHSGKAKRYVRVAQMAGLALGMSAAVLWAFDVPGLGHREPRPPEVPSMAPPQPAQTAELRLERERTEDMAVRLEMGVRRPPEPPKQTEVKAPEEPMPIEAMPSGPEITYLGPIYEAEHLLAVIAIDGRQRIVREGRLVGDYRLVSVRENEIVLRNDRGERKIALGDRTGPAVSWLRTLPGGAGAGVQHAGVRRPATAQVRTQASAQGGFSPEMEQRFRERGIDPAQAARWREMMRERQAGRVTTTTAEGMVMAETEMISEEEGALTRDMIEDDEFLMRIQADGEEFDEELLRRLREEGDEEAMRRMMEGQGYNEDERMPR